MEEKFTARDVWDVQAARALVRAVQKPSPWKLGVGCALIGVVWLAIALWFEARLFGWICFAAWVVVGVYIAFGWEAVAAKRVYAQACGRCPESAVTFGAETVESRDEYSRATVRYECFRRFALCRGRYLLFYQKEGALIFAPESVSGGGAQALEAFVREKTGLTLETIR